MLPFRCSTPPRSQLACRFKTGVPPDLLAANDCRITSAMAIVFSILRCRSHVSTSLEARSAKCWWHLGGSSAPAQVSASPSFFQRHLHFHQQYVRALLLLWHDCPTRLKFGGLHPRDATSYVSEHLSRFLSPSKGVACSPQVTHISLPCFTLFKQTIDAQSAQTAKCAHDEESHTGQQTLLTNKYR